MRQSFSGIDTVTKHVDEEGDAAVADVVVALRDEAVPRRRVRRRGHLHAHAAEKHTGTELSIEQLFEIANISSWRRCNATYLIILIQHKRSLLKGKRTRESVLGRKQ